MLVKYRKLLFAVSIFFSFFPHALQAQVNQGYVKPIIDTSVFNRWPHVDAGSISSNGLYACYHIGAQNLDSIYIVSLNSKWKIGLDASSGFQFLPDGKRGIIHGANDSLFTILLGGSSRIYVGQMPAGEFLMRGKNSNWLVYKVNSSGETRSTHFRNLSTNKEWIFNNDLISYQLSPGGNQLLYVSRGAMNQPEMDSVRLINLSVGQTKLLYAGPSTQRLENFVFDESEKQLCFMSLNPNRYGVLNVLYYSDGMPSAKIIDKHVAEENNLMFSRTYPPIFSHDGYKLYLWMDGKGTETRHVLDPGCAQLSIWRYADEKLKSSSEQNNAIVVLDTKTFQVNKIIGANDLLPSFTFDDLGRGKENNWIMTSENGGSLDYFMKDALWANSLVSAKDGSRKIIKADVTYNKDNFYLSPGERFVIWFDPSDSDYYSYETATDKIRNITAGIPTNFKNIYSHSQGIIAEGYGVAGWLPNDEAALIYDEYDIWQVDPSGVRKPVCVTNQYGARQHIRFRTFAEWSEHGSHIYPAGESIVLSAFNTSNKESGFFRVAIEKTADLEKLSMGSYLYETPFKADAGAEWIVRRQSATEAPNYFVSKDLRTYTAISDINPQRKYNWLTSELIHWTQSDGTPGTGILYKPENFDPAKKYPLLFNYYESRTGELNEFKEPAATGDFINVPYFVSQGYLVCLPDISFDVPGRNNGESAVNSVVSCAEYLSKMPWIDGAKMGIQGHSFSGATTNYLITHSHLFAAAEEGAGSSDLITSQLSLAGYGGSRQDFEVASQGRATGKSMWEMGPEYYVNASPIFRADKVTTPLLMMHNPKDGAVPWNEGLQMFLSLRRVGKRVWWLVYDDGGHGVEGADAIDYTIRINQFFDHYLKGVPPPKWMTEGIPDSRKGIDFGYELDRSGKEPEELPVMYMGKMQLVKDAAPN